MSSTHRLICTQNVAQIQADCAWYFDMCNLIAQRPNLVPTGLGNANTAVAHGVIIPMPTAVADAEGDTALEGHTGEDDEGTSSVPFDWEPSPPPQMRGKKRAFEVSDDKEGKELQASEDDYHPLSSVTSESAPVPVDDGDEGEEDGGKQKDDEEVEVEGKKEKKKGTHRKTPAKPSTSKPAAPTPSVAPKASKKTKLAEFSEIAKNEEQTCQKEIELATLRTRQQMKALEVKGQIVEKQEERHQANAEAKRQERMLKLEMKKQRMEYAHALRMATMGTGGMSSSASHADTSFDIHSRTSGSHYSSSDYADFDGFNGNALAGSSTGAGTELDLSTYQFSFSK